MSRDFRTRGGDEYVVDKLVTDKRCKQCVLFEMAVEERKKKRSQWAGRCKRFGIAVYARGRPLQHGCFQELR